MSTKRDSPFSQLEHLRDQLPKGVQQTVAPVPDAPKPGPKRAVVRYERKQRGGKEVTVVEKLDLKAAELEQWCKELKQALGCGGFVEETTIVLQGDLRKRLPDLLTKKGVAKVTVS
ncbi:MAG TPA: translation initiation factor [Kofleriaceae bacterium]|nr:translation initiation factor [Kofleriaceae bacterium]